MSPNIVLIMSDQHNPHAMGCAGNPIVQTPNLDALARRGVRFGNAYCPYPLCAPSRSGFILTARKTPNALAGGDMVKGFCRL